VVTGGRNLALRPFGCSLVHPYLASFRKAAGC